MYQNEATIELDLKALFFYILRQWKSITVFALAAAVLLGSLQAFLEYKTGVEMDETDDYWVEYQRYEDQLALYRDQIAVTESKIDTLQDYIDHSILMKADSRNIYIAKTTYYIDSNYKILPENTYQDPNKTLTLTWYYQNYLNDYSVYVDIGEEVGLEAKYLMELVSVSTVNDETLSISVTHPYERSARSIMEILKQKLQDVHTHLEASVADHTLTMMMDTCGVYVDDSLNDVQQQVYNELLTYQNDLIQFKQNLHNLEEDGGPGELNVLVAFVKWFIVGSVLGVVLAAAYYFVKAIFCNRVMAPGQLVSGFKLPVMGEMLRKDLGKDTIGKLLNKWEGRLQENSEENMRFLAENIKNHCTGVSNILVSSDISIQESEEFVASVAKFAPEIRFTAVGSLLKESHALQELPKCDVVLRLVSKDQSSNASIAKEMNLIRECRKEMLGFVFIG